MSLAQVLKVKSEEANESQSKAAMNNFRTNVEEEGRLAAADGLFSCTVEGQTKYANLFAQYLKAEGFTFTVCKGASQYYGHIPNDIYTVSWVGVEESETPK